MKGSKSSGSIQKKNAKTKSPTRSTRTSKKTTNGSSATGKSEGIKKISSSPSLAPSSSSSSSSSSLQISRIYYIFAIVSFIAGICTPPLYSIVTNRPNSRTGNATINASSSTTSPSTTSSKIQKGELVEVDIEEEKKEKEADVIVEKNNNESNGPPSSFMECNTENLSQFLHDVPMRGMHILCFPPPSSSSTSTSTSSPNNKKQDQHQQQQMHIYRKAVSSHEQQKQQYPLYNTFTELKSFVHNELYVDAYNDETSLKQPWAIYSTNGERIVDELFDSRRKMGRNTDHGMNMLQSHGMVILFEGGSWLWPGVRIGFKRVIEIDDQSRSGTGTSTFARTNPTKQNITIETLSLFPLVLSVEDFISEKECTHVQNKATPDMEYSEVTLMDRDLGRPASDFRTSQSTFVRAYKDKIMTRLEHRTASLTRVPRNHQEDTQVLRYGIGERYSAHLDWFDRELYLQDKNTLHLVRNGRNRLATVFWYLSDVEDGGHTAFPRFDKAPQPRDFEDCTKGLLVKPQRGKVIIFYSLTADGKGDAFSLHGACAVKEGIKWAANKWVWNTPQAFVNY